MKTNLKLHLVLAVASFLMTLACSKPSSAAKVEDASFKTSQQQHPHEDHDHAHDRGAEPATEAASGTILKLNPDALRDLRLTVRKAEKRPAGDTITAFGSLELDPNSISALSTPVPARIVSISKNIGERVTAGETLVELESLEIGRARFAVESARSRVSIAKSRQSLAQQQRNRTQELLNSKMATIRELQTAEAELVSRNGDLAEAEIQQRDAERAFALFGVEPGTAENRFVLRAAKPGIVSFRDGSTGESVEGNHIFLRFSDHRSLVAVAHPFERDGIRIDSGASAQISVAAHPGKIFKATFLRSGPEVEPTSRTLPVRLAVSNEDGSLLPGMSVTAEIRLASTAQEVVTVPLAAAQKIEKDWCVFLPRGAGKFERRVIARGRDLGGEIEVLSGLAPGDEVVVEGAFVLRSESTRGEDTGDEHHH